MTTHRDWFHYEDDDGPQPVTAADDSQIKLVLTRADVRFLKCMSIRRDGEVADAPA